jgi:hypothetical protein
LILKSAVQTGRLRAARFVIGVFDIADRGLASVGETRRFQLIAFRWFERPDPGIENRGHEVLFERTVELRPRRRLMLSSPLG